MISPWWDLNSRPLCLRGAWLISSKILSFIISYLLLLWDRCNESYFSQVSSLLLFFSQIAFLHSENFTISVKYFFLQSFSLPYPPLSLSPPLSLLILLNFSSTILFHLLHYFLSIDASILLTFCQNDFRIQADIFVASSQDRQMFIQLKLVGSLTHVW